MELLPVFEFYYNALVSCVIEEVNGAFWIHAGVSIGSYINLFLYEERKTFTKKKRVFLRKKFAKNENPTWQEVRKEAFGKHLVEDTEIIERKGILGWPAILHIPKWEPCVSGWERCAAERRSVSC